MWGNHSVCFSVGERTAAKEGKGDGLPVGAKKGTEPLLHTTGREISPSPSQQEVDQQKLSNKPLLSSTKTPSESTVQFHNIACSSLPQGCHALIFILSPIYKPHPYNPGAGHAIYPPLIKTKITMCLQKCPPKPRDRREVRR